MASSMKWTVYHETERDYDAPPEKLREDLNYLKKWFAWHPAWAHIDGKPVIFVYNEGSSGNGCDVIDRWNAASNHEWYVVLKLFKGFRDCPDSPDSWHQYGPAEAVSHVPGHSFSVSPGFWRADKPVPDLDRVPADIFCSNVESMVNSTEKWQLITTFNEAGEGTMVEASSSWIDESTTKHGWYLDCLHKYH